MMAKTCVDVERVGKSYKMREKALKGVDWHGKMWKGMGSVERRGKVFKAWIYYASDKC